MRTNLYIVTSIWTQIINYVLLFELTKISLFRQIILEELDLIFWRKIHEICYFVCIMNIILSFKNVWSLRIKSCYIAKLYMYIWNLELRSSNDWTDLWCYVYCIINLILLFSLLNSWTSVWTSTLFVSQCAMQTIYLHLCQLTTLILGIWIFLHWNIFKALFEGTFILIIANGH